MSAVPPESNRPTVEEQSGPARSDLGFRTRYQRSPELLRNTLSMLCHYVWHKALREGEHLWSIPVDPLRDFDCILSDAIEELVTARQSQQSLREALQKENEQLKQEIARLTATPQVPDSVKELQRDAMRIYAAEGLLPAVRFVRNTAGIGLREAKDTVDRWAALSSSPVTDTP